MNFYIRSYPKDELNSINKQICFSPSRALLVDDFIEHPGHFQIQCNLAGPKSIGPSVVVEKYEAIRTNPSPPAPVVALIGSKRGVPNSKKYQPKFDHHQLEFNPVKYAKVFITKATSPNLIYVQIIDEDILRYHKMDEDLQLEFRTATVQSCTSPVIGN